MTIHIRQETPEEYPAVSNLIQEAVDPPAFSHLVNGGPIASLTDDHDQRHLVMV